MQPEARLYGQNRALLGPSEPSETRFGPDLAVFGVKHPKSPQNTPKHPKSARFSPVQTLLEPPRIGPIWGLFGPIWAQKGPKRPQNGPKRVFWGCSRGAQVVRTPKTPPKHRFQPQNGLLSPYAARGPVLACFRGSFGPLLSRLEPVLAGFGTESGVSGVILGLRKWCEAVRTPILSRIGQNRPQTAPNGPH